MSGTKKKFFLRGGEITEGTSLRGVKQASQKGTLPNAF